MTKKIAFWLESIVEDDPLPDEIDIIVIKVNIQENYRHIELLGMENELNLNKCVYRPLEAQFFFDREFLNCNINVFIHRLKTAIDNAFLSTVLKQQYKDRKFYLYINSFEYLFKV